MPRFKITVEYDGKGLVGWQKQNTGASVQQYLEEAVEAFSSQKALVQGAGRTDAGVHALAQVAHFDIDKDVSPDRVRDALNAHLKMKPVVVLKAEEVDERFHARFTAVGRSYLYRIINRRAPLAVDRGKAWWVPVALDVDAMNKAANVLIGEHDFSSFRASECQANSPIKTLDKLEVQKVGSEIRVVAKARSFLHHQVRNFVGTLKFVGEGKWTSEDVYRILDAKDRRKAGPTAPAYGLYLTGVKYPPKEQWNANYSRGEDLIY